MTINRLRLSAIFLLLAVNGICLISAHPVYQHHFNRIVNADPCLKACMDAATAQDHELSMLKTANVSEFLLDLDHICNTTSTARECIAACNITSNPFALDSLRAPCLAVSRTEARLLTPCLGEHGVQMAEDCAAACGDYEAISAEIQQLSSKYDPELEEAEKVADVLHKVNEGCATLKCSNRCMMREAGQRCGKAVDGRQSSAIFRSLVERVLLAQRHDLDRMKLTDTMANSVPLQCNYMYMPEVMFDVERDESALTAIGESLRNEHHAKLLSALRAEGKTESNNATAAAVVLDADASHHQQAALAEQGDDRIPAASKKHLNFALTQLQARMMHKQTELLHLQELNLKKESKKLDIELELAVRKMNLLRQLEKATPTDADPAKQLRK